MQAFVTFDSVLNRFVKNRATSIAMSSAYPHASSKSFRFTGLGP